MQMTDTLRPPHAISLWANNEVLYVELPNTHISFGQSHQLKLPLNVYGLTQVVNILRSRSSQSRVGELGDPTQHQADAAIKQMQRAAAGYKGPITKPKAKISATPEQRSTIRDILRKVGIS